MVVTEGLRAPLSQADLNEYLKMNSSDENLDRLLKVAKEQEA
jgi:hypothetical protein